MAILFKYFWFRSMLVIKRYVDPKKKAKKRKRHLEKRHCLQHGYNNNQTVMMNEH